MKLMYQLNFLAVEGMYKPHDNDGYLMEGFRGGAAWAGCKYRQQFPRYDKLFNYLLSVAMSGVIITCSRDMYMTAFNICCLYDYFQKPWDRHTSMEEIEKLPMWEVGGRSSLVKRWAAQFDGVGVRLATEAEQTFVSGKHMGLSNVEDWAGIKGIGRNTAVRIVKEIRGE